MDKTSVRQRIAKALGITEFTTSMSVGGFRDAPLGKPIAPKIKRRERLPRRGR